MPSDPTQPGSRRPALHPANCPPSRPPPSTRPSDRPGPKQWRHDMRAALQVQTSITVHPPILVRERAFSGRPPFGWFLVPNPERAGVVLAKDPERTGWVRKMALRALHGDGVHDIRRPPPVARTSGSRHGACRPVGCVEAGGLGYGEGSVRHRVREHGTLWRGLYRADPRSTIPAAQTVPLMEDTRSWSRLSW